MNKMCIFDIDGTLVKDIDYSRALNKTIEELNMNSIYLEEIKRKFKFTILSFLSKCKSDYNNASIDVLSSLLREKLSYYYGENLDTYKELILRYLENEILLSQNALLIKGTKETLERLKELGYILMIYSNWFIEVQKTKLESTGIKDYFSSIYTIDNNYAKNATKGFERIKALEGVTPEDSIYMIGNSTSDIPPVRVNILPIILRNESEISQPIIKKNPMILDNPIELKRVLK